MDSALSAPRGDASSYKKFPAGRTSAKATGDISDDDSIGPDGSSQSKERRLGKRDRSELSNSGMSKSKKRKPIEDPNTVVIYNIPPQTERATLVDFVERTLRIKIVRCQCISNSPERLTFLVTFETSALVETAISLNGVQFFNHTIYVSIYNPDWGKDKTKKLRLCFNSFFRECERGNLCRHAHGVLDLKLHHDTVLSANRTIYLNQLPPRYPPESLLNLVRNKLITHGISPFFTALHVRGEKGDAVVEFADMQHAKKARGILNGIAISTCDKLKVHPWKPEYQSFFVEYFENEAKTRGEGHRDRKQVLALKPPPKSTRWDDNCRIKDSSFSRKQAHPTVDWEDDKRDLRRLRKRLANLEEEISDYKRLLAEAHDDVRYYRDRFERERSYVKDVRRMEDKRDDLRRENDHLIRDYHSRSSECYGNLQDELHDTRLEYKKSQVEVDKLKRENEALVRENDILINENDDLRRKQNDSRCSRGDRDVENNLQDELDSTRLKYEDSRNQVYKLKWELDKTLDEKEVLLRDSKRLKSAVECPESNRNSVKMENQQVPAPQRHDELQSRLDEALSKVETLNGAVITAHLKLKKVESEKDSANATVADLREQNETLQEEMDQMRMNHAMELGFMGSA